MGKRGRFLDRINRIYRIIFSPQRYEECKEEKRRN
jgi:hypothetical protein